MKPATVTIVILALLLASCTGGKTQSADLTDSPAAQAAAAIAERWITAAPTYAFDGKDLEFKDSKTISPGQYLLTFTFSSSHGGYGNRTGNMLSQIITPHRINVKVVDNEVTFALIDGKWDEVNQQYALRTGGNVSNQGNASGDADNVPQNAIQNNPDAPVTIKYQPAQCDRTPWQDWYAQGKILFVQAPTDEQVLIPYYAQNYEVEVSDYRQVESGMNVCEACSICPTPFYITVSVKERNANLMTRLGWERI